MMNFYESSPPLGVPSVHTYLFVGNRPTRADSLNPSRAAECTGSWKRLTTLPGSRSYLLK